jgi:menaquinone-dependent protoporphyrinogen oxidase
MGVKKEDEMRVLVSAASRHGATAEIAKAIGEVLAERGLEVSVIPPDEVKEVASFDAFVLGSAIYLNKWLEPATTLIDDHYRELGNPKVWLFSSGPIEDLGKGVKVPKAVDEVIDLTRAVDHRMFGGKIAGRKLNLLEKWFMRIVKSPEGDFRDWIAIRAWAEGIADRLLAVPEVESRR